MGDSALNSLDPEMVKVFLSSIILYAPGLEVVLSDGRLARVVIRNQLGFPLRPVLELLDLDSENSGTRTSAGILHFLEHPTLFNRLSAQVRGRLFVSIE